MLSFILFDLTDQKTSKINCSCTYCYHSDNIFSFPQSLITLYSVGLFAKSNVVESFGLWDQFFQGIKGLFGLSRVSQAKHVSVNGIIRFMRSIFLRYPSIHEPGQKSWGEGLKKLFDKICRGPKNVLKNGIF